MAGMQDFSSQHLVHGDAGPRKNKRGRVRCCAHGRTAADRGWLCRLGDMIHLVGTCGENWGGACHVAVGVEEAEREEEK